MSILPRQARDKHGENYSEKDRFLAVPRRIHGYGKGKSLLFFFFFSSFQLSRDSEQVTKTGSGQTETGNRGEEAFFWQGITRTPLGRAGRVAQHRSQVWTTTRSTTVRKTAHLF
jgi:hypothetical protein